MKCIILVYKFMSVTYAYFIFIFTDTETDIETLLECLKCQKRNTSGFKQSLMTLSSILCSNGQYFSQMITWINLGNISKCCRTLHSSILILQISHLTKFAVLWLLAHKNSICKHFPWQFYWWQKTFLISAMP